jgi:hypothetical protein
VIEKQLVSGKSMELENVEGVETVDCVRSHAEEVVAQYLKHSLGLSHHYLRGTAVTAIVCLKLPVDAGWLASAAS